MVQAPFLQEITLQGMLQLRVEIPRPESLWGSNIYEIARVQMIYNR